MAILGLIHGKGLDERPHIPSGSDVGSGGFILNHQVFSAEKLTVEGRLPRHVLVRLRNSAAQDLRDEIFARVIYLNSVGLQV